MTTEPFTEVPNYTVSGIGPYAIPHEYTSGAVKPVIEADGADPVALDEAEYSINPDSGDEGNLTLSVGAAATYEGAQIYLYRETSLQQGWVGQSGAREKGLERQLDLLAQGGQDALDAGNRSLRLRRGRAEPYEPQDGHVPYWNAGRQGFDNGPTFEQIEDAVDFAEAAKQSEEKSKESEESAAESAIEAALYDPTFRYATPALLVSSERAPSVPGTVRQGGEHLYVEMPAGTDVASDSNPGGYHLATAGGALLRLMKSADGKYSLNALGVDDAGSVDCSSLLKRLVESASAGDCITWSGTLLRDRDASGLDIEVPSGVHLEGSHGAVLKQVGYPALKALGNQKIAGFRLDGSASGSQIGIEVRGDHVWLDGLHFLKGNERVRLYTADYFLASFCHFEETGYGVIQRVGYTSNYGRTIGCTWTKVVGDCIELNAETGNPCVGWAFYNSVATDIGGENPTSVGTEDRFLGATSTRGIIVDGLTINGCRGDSVFHLEGTAGDVKISNFDIRNIHGAYGSLLYVVSSLSAPGIIKLSNGTVRLDADWAPISGDGNRLIYDMAGGDANIAIRDVDFINESAVEDLQVFRSSSDNSRNLTVEGGYISGFYRGFRFGLAYNRLASVKNVTWDSPKDNYGASVPALVFIEYRSGDGRLVEIEDCVASGGGDLWLADDVRAAPVSLKRNWVYNGTNIDEASMIGLKVFDPNCRDNIIGTGGATNRVREYDCTGGDEIVLADLTGTFPDDIAPAVIATVTSSSPGSTSVKTTKTVLLQYSGPELGLVLTELNVASSGGGASFTLSTKGPFLVGTDASDRTISISLVNTDDLHVGALVVDSTEQNDDPTFAGTGSWVLNGNTTFSSNTMVKTSGGTSQARLDLANIVAGDVLLIGMTVDAYAGEAFAIDADWGGGPDFLVWSSLFSTPGTIWGIATAPTDVPTLLISRSGSGTHTISEITIKKLL